MDLPMKKAMSLELVTAIVPARSFLREMVENLMKHVLA
jgi:hypothetical protein